MSGYLNRVQLIGNLGQDPEVRSTQAGKKIVTLSIATSEIWNDPQSGERRERTEWHRVVIFNEGLAKIAEKYLNKGAKVLIEGKLPPISGRIVTATTGIRPRCRCSPITAR